MDLARRSRGPLRALPARPGSSAPAGSATGPVGNRRPALHHRALGLLLAFWVLLAATLGIGAAFATTPAFAGLAAERAQASQLAQEIAQQGQMVQALVARSDAAQAHLDAVTAQLQAARQRLALAQMAAAQATQHLRAVAIAAYMTGAGTQTNLSLFETGSASALLAQQEYTAIAGNSLQTAIEHYQLARHQAAADASQLAQAQQAAQQAATTLTQERQAAQSALAQETALLQQVKGQIAQQVAAQIAQQLAAEQQAREAALAAAAQAAAAQGPPPTVAVNAAPGAYANPLRAIAALNPERIDQGVDYSGYGPIYAIGDGVVLNTVNSGWPGGTFIAYRLTDGPAAGLVVYAAEDIQPEVSVGQTVTPNTVLGTMYEGPDGIETGWADPSALGETMAMAYGQFSGANSTAFGANFSQLLASLGAPPGILQNSPPTGSLPPGWPSW
ncbi:M23 family metallopeptidase [Aciditerrimonas ferrireducens]|uniref:M23 family metallopeptidase n=1 Tax=Aciditerrimonas ferrireducens TaxID=667306 RepID=A0ABV6C515_9ACTN